MDWKTVSVCGLMCYVQFVHAESRQTCEILLPDPINFIFTMQARGSYFYIICSKRLLLALGRVVVSLISLSSEAPDTVVATANITGVQIVQVPPQTPESVLAGFNQKIHFSSRLLLHPLNVTLHVELRVSGADDGHLHVQELGQSLLPFVRACGVAETGVEAYYCVEVRVERSKVLRVVEGVEVFDVSADLHLTSKAIFDDGAEGV
jgi:hypothetical protein